MLQFTCMQMMTYLMWVNKYTGQTKCKWNQETVSLYCSWNPSNTILDSEVKVFYQVFHSALMRSSLASFSLYSLVYLYGSTTLYFWKKAQEINRIRKRNWYWCFVSQLHTFHLHRNIVHCFVTMTHEAVSARFFTRHLVPRDSTIIKDKVPQKHSAQMH